MAGNIEIPAEVMPLLEEARALSPSIASLTDAALIELLLHAALTAHEREVLS